MMVVAVVQIFLRNLLDLGLVWGDPMLRMLVLWVGLFGAMVAGRCDSHIRIDLLNRYLPSWAANIARGLSGCFTALTCGIFSYYGFRFARFEFEDGGTAFGNVPAWVCASIIPLAFSVIAIRSLISAITQFTRTETPSS
jgi:TRAP-type C4-dicarboxylate transport system permease small subunit